MSFLKGTRLTLVVICAVQLFCNQAISQEAFKTVTASTDVEATMKTMSLTYKQAMKTTEPSTMLGRIDKLQHLVASVQLVKFDKKRHAILQQGLSEVQAQLSLVHRSLTHNDITAAKAQLEKVAELRKRYHKERSPDIWQLIFGDE
ncbi:hypothetical protein GMES_1300 [Paraglaciecola mesophila KMM 241]|uniref:Cytochrome b562 n=1 Tax=Paraglaciecola mesophila KMM 241 TaxID=1128912 RepID=K6XSJ5_9ALTE|nr:cytochrome b562 [Paraglaciecola mesophila]GAC23599.1 hypothetical protein GMES_1300 [Paraglaciecola mesophila KMM 241]